MSEWKVEPLGEVCEILDNQRIPITKSNRKPGKYPYYGATGIIDYVDGYIFDEPLVLVGEDGAKWESGENTAFAIRGKSWINNHAHVLRPKRSMLTDNWLTYFLVYANLSKFISGMTVPKLTQGNLRKILVPIPPLSVQQKIIRTLDVTFNAIAIAKSNTEKNLKNTHTLIKSCLDIAFNQNENRQQEKHLSELAKVIVGQSPKGEYYNTNNMGMPFYQGKKEFQERFIGEPRVWTTKVTRIAMEGDILMSIRAPVGPINFATQEICIGRGLAAIRVGDLLDCNFLFYCLLSRQGEIVGTKGAVFNSLNRNQIERIKIAAFSLSKQRQIISKLDTLSGGVQKLQMNYQKKIAALDELKKSYLHQAFSGKL